MQPVPLGFYLRWSDESEIALYIIIAADRKKPIVIPAFSLKEKAQKPSTD
jgi:hypothetical protein